MYHAQRTTAVAALLTLTLAAGCASSGGSAPAPERTLAARAAELEIAGPLRTVCVGDFTAVDGFVDRYGGWDVGGGVAAMLTTALTRSGRFVVVERPRLTGVMAEQELAAQGLTNPQSAARAGELLGAQLVVYGAVTEFGEDESGGGVGLGASGGGLGGLLSGALSRRKTSGTVGLDLRVVDTTTGEVVASEHVRAELEGSATDFSLGYEGVAFGADGFERTPIGQATRQAVEDAVLAVARAAQRSSWTGRVVDVDARAVCINAGASAGVRVGDTFAVERVTKVLTDPETGRVLGARKAGVGTLQVTEVDEGVAFAAFAPAGGTSPERGDLVVLR